MKNKALFFAILLSAFYIRVFTINWDQGFHLHPDERMLIMVADKISFFKNLNPDFFNYGSLPIYLLKGSSQILDFFFKKNLSNYNDMLLIGRFISVFFDLITVLLVYKISQMLFKSNKVSLFSSFLYTVAFFPIQNSHFFVVDVLLNTLITGLIYTLLLYLKSSSIKTIVVLSFIFAAMMATKFTAIIFFPIIIFVIFFTIIKPSHTKFTISEQIKYLLFSLFVFVLSFFTIYFIFMPYAFIEKARFIFDIKAQLKMSSDPYIFPYTLQYVTSIPYLYYLKNIFLWGLGPIISLLSIVGFLSVIYLKKISFVKKNKLLILFFFFYLFYFLIIGRSAVKFMRYMLPLYPFLTILAGYGLYKIFDRFKTLTFLLITCILVWTLMFVNIFSFPHTRISATNWILKNIPEGSTLAVEHWDDRVPIYNGDKYLYQELTIYDQPDNQTKWLVLNEKLLKSDYIIIASNRLYFPLQKLSDCKQFKLCYPMTTKYYQELFNNKLSFRKVAEFSVYPQFRFLNFNFVINDDYADESFTVYDHPKIIIFKKI